MHRTATLGVPATMTVATALACVVAALCSQATGVHAATAFDEPSSELPLSHDGSGHKASDPAHGTVGDTFVFAVAADAFGSDGGVSVALNATPAGEPAPLPGQVSATAFDRSSPAGPASLLLPTWGQCVTHDIMRTVANATPTESIDMPWRAGSVGDGGPTYPFKRMRHALTEAGRRRFVNHCTSWLDASQVYGLDDAQAGAMREGAGGRLLMAADSDSGENMPPLAGAAGARPLQFVFGDPREMATPLTASINILLRREHNRRAAELAQQYPGWDDDRLYDTARRWVVATMQHITVSEYVPSLTGSMLPQYAGHDPDVDARVDTLFGVASFRYGHSATPEALTPLNAEWKALPQLPLLLLRDTFGDAAPWTELATTPNGDEPEADPLAAMLRGAVARRDAAVDVSVVDDLRGGHFEHAQFDIAAINVMRGRDAGLPRYNDARAAYGLPRKTSFADLTGETAERASQPGSVAASLAAAYNGDIDLVDAWVGIIAEPHVAGGHVGELAKASIVEQITRLRDGDALWYEGDALLGPETRAAVMDRGLADVIRDNVPAMAWVPTTPFLPLDIGGAGVPQLQPDEGGGGDGGGEGDGAVADAEFAAAFDHTVGLSSTYTLYWSVEPSEGVDEEAFAADIEAGVAPDGVLRVGMVLTDADANWAGFGIGRDMVNADVFVVFLSEGAAATAGADAVDKWSVFFSPEKDVDNGGSNDIVAGSVSGAADSTDGRRVVKLQAARPLRAVNAGLDLDVLPGTRNYIFAHGSAAVPSYHGPQKRGTVELDLYTGTITCADAGTVQVLSVRQLHGAVMFLAWCVCAPAGVAVARYFKTSNWWLWAHAALQKTAVSGAVPLAVVAIAGKPRHFDHEHAAIGILAMSAVIAQMGLGFATKWGLSFSASSRWHGVSRVVHRWTGRLVVLAGMTNAFFGLGWLFADGAGPWRLALSCHLGMIVAAFAVLESYKRWPAASHRAYVRAMCVVTCGRRTVQVADLHGGDTIDLGDIYSGLPVMTWSDVTERVNRGAQYVVAAGMVLDVHQWCRIHPGGYNVLQEAIGTDVTAELLGRQTATRVDATDVAHAADAPMLQAPLITSAATAGTVGLALVRVSSMRRRKGKDTTKVEPKPGMLRVLSRKSVRKAPEPRRRHRVHMHSASAWSKMPDLVVGILEENSTAGDATGREADRSSSAEADNERGYSHQASSLSATRPVLSPAAGVASRHARLQRLLLTTRAARARAQQGRRFLGSLVDGGQGLAAAQLALDSLCASYLTDAATPQHTSGRPFRVVLVGSRRLTPESSRAPVYRMEFAPPQAVSVPVLLPGQHFWLMVSDHAHSSIVERRYTPMIDAAGIVDGNSSRNLETRGALPVPAATAGLGGTGPAVAPEVVVGGGGDRTGTEAAWEVKSVSEIGDLETAGGSGDGGGAGEQKAEPAAGKGASAAAAAAAAPTGTGDGRRNVVFAIKLYPDGAASKLLSRLRPGDNVRLRGPSGPDLTCSTGVCKRWTHLGLVAGGSGLTPMLQLVAFQLSSRRAIEAGMDLSLLFLNRREDDLFLEAELRGTARTSNGVFRVAFGLSQPQDAGAWDGYVGRVDSRMLRETMPPVPGSPEAVAAAASSGVPVATAENTLIVVCGPPGLMGTVARLLEDMGYPEGVVWLFE